MGRRTDDAAVTIGPRAEGLYGCQSNDAGGKQAGCRAKEVKGTVHVSLMDEGEYESGPGLCWGQRLNLSGSSSGRMHAESVDDESDQSQGLRLMPQTPQQAAAGSRAACRQTS